MSGVFGVGARFSPWPGFSAHVVDRAGPFISETGYRSLLGLRAALVAGLTVDAFTKGAVAAYIREALKGKLVKLTAK